MSHYTVAVIVDKLDENEVAKMLAPYQEKYIVLVDCHI